MDAVIDNTCLTSSNSGSIPRSWTWDWSLYASGVLVDPAEYLDHTATLSHGACSYLCYAIVWLRFKTCLCCTVCRTIFHNITITWQRAECFTASEWKLVWKLRDCKCQVLHNILVLCNTYLIQYIHAESIGLTRMFELSKDGPIKSLPQKASCYSQSIRVILHKLTHIILRKSALAP